MTKIIDPDDLNVGTEITIDTTAKTFTLVAAGGLVAKDGVTLQALYSKFVDLWTTATYNKYAFPMYTIDAKSGQYIFGTDGAQYNGWKPANDATRQMLRDGGWSEYLSNGTLDRQYVGVVSLGDANSGAQIYYQRTPAGAANNFTFTDETNEGILVYQNGSLDERTYFKAYLREQGYRYAESTLADTGLTETGPYKINVLLANTADTKIAANDAAMSGAPYSGITLTWIDGNGFTNATVGSLTVNDVRKDTAGRWFKCTSAGTIDAAGVANYTANGGTAVLAAYAGERQIGTSYYAYNIIANGNNATAEQIYTKIQYLLRQNTDIDSGAGTHTGKITQALMAFLGDTLTTTTGVYIDNFNTNDINRLVFTDVGGTGRTLPYAATGVLTFNSFLTAGGTGYYRMYFVDLPGSNDYGLAGAVTVKDTTGADIQGAISAGSIPFTFDYDANIQGGRTPGTDAQVAVVAGNAGSAKPVVAFYTITRSTGQGITLTAEQDRAYLP